MKQLFLLYIFVFLFAHHATSQTKHKFPVPVGFVNDFEKVLTPLQINALDSILSIHEKQTTNQIAIVSIDSIAPYKNIYDFSLDLFNSWGIGTQEKNNGVAIIFSAKMRIVRIVVGSGLETKLTDAESKIIIDTQILQWFKKGQYYDGLKAGTLAIINEIN